MTTHTGEAPDRARGRWGYCHLPSVTLVDTEQLPLTQGSLVRVPFEEWLRLDPSWSRAEMRYNHSQPVFYVEPVSDPPDSSGEDWNDAFMARVGDIHHAFLLGTALDNPDPRISVMYRHDADHGAVSRHIGPAGRELIMHKDERLRLTTDHAVALRLLVDRVAAARHLIAGPALTWPMHALSVTSMPDFELLDGVVHCVSALESALMPAGSGIAPKLRRRAATLLAWTGADRDATHDLLREAYRLRSDVIHGRDVRLSPERSEQLPELYATLRRCVAVVAQALLIRPVGALGEVDARGLRADLDRGWNAPDRLDDEATRPVLLEPRDD